jgi:WD40 repeat protein
MSFRSRLLARRAYALALVCLPAVLLSVSSLVQRPAHADTVITAGADKKVKIWSATDGTLLKTIDAHDGAVTAAALSSDGKILATGGADKKIKLWNAADGTLIQSVDGHDGDVTALSFSADGKQLFSGGADKKVNIWKLADGKLPTKPTQSLDAQQDKIVGVFSVGDLVITGSADGSVKICDAQANYANPIPLDTAQGGLTCMAGNATHQELYTGGKDGTLKYWSQAAQSSFDGMQGSAITSIVVSSDGKQVLTGGADGKVKVWDTDKHKLLTTIDAGHTGGVTAIAISPDGNLIVTGGADKKICGWSASGTLLKTVEVPDGAVNVILFRKEAMAAPGK